MPCIERFVLRVTHPAELFIGRWRLRAVALPNKLNHSFALIDLLTKQSTQIASLGSENVLPYWLITEEGQRVGNKLSGTANLSAYRRNKD